MAVVFNAGNNALNQIYDLEIDRVNKPKRPLPSGRLSISQAWSFTVDHVRADARLAWLVAPGGRRECFWIVLVAIVVHVHLLRSAAAHEAASACWANITIAIPRGVLLKVAGWSAVKTVVWRRAVVHRRHLRLVPARRIDDQGLRRHGRRPSRRMPHAADSSTASGARRG